MVCKQDNNTFVTPLQQFCNGFESFDTTATLSHTQTLLQNHCKYVAIMLQFMALGTKHVHWHSEYISILTFTWCNLLSVVSSNIVHLGA